MFRGHLLHGTWNVGPFPTGAALLRCPQCKVSATSHTTPVPAANQASLSSPSDPSPPSPSAVTAGLQFLPHRPQKRSSYLFPCPTSTETTETACLHDGKRKLERGAHPSNDTQACSTPSSVRGTETQKRGAIVTVIAAARTQSASWVLVFRVNSLHPHQNPD